MSGTGDNSGAFFFATGSDVHRAVAGNTVDEIAACQRLVMRLAPDADTILEYLFGAPTEVQRQSTGRATESA